MDKWTYRLSTALAVFGLFVSAYLTIYKLTENDKMCLGSGDCAAVNASLYSEIYSIPVAAIGVGGYFSIFAVLAAEKRSPFLQKNNTLIVFGLALVGFLFTLYLIYVELRLIRALCPFCVASQATMIMLFILSVIRLIRQPIY